MFNRLYNRLFARTFERHSLISRGVYINIIMKTLKNMGVPTNTMKVTRVYDRGHHLMSICRLTIYVTGSEWNELLAFIDQDDHLRERVKTQ